MICFLYELLSYWGLFDFEADLLHFQKSLFPFLSQSFLEKWRLKTYFLWNCYRHCLGPFQVHFFQFQGFDSSRDKLTQQHQIAILLIGLLTYQAQVVRWVWDKFKITFSGQSFQTWISQKVKIFLDLNRRKMFSLQTCITNKLNFR